jgi:hypothetical protein
MPLARANLPPICEAVRDVIAVINHPEGPLSPNVLSNLKRGKWPHPPESLGYAGKLNWSRQALLVVMMPAGVNMGHGYPDLTGTDLCDEVVETLIAVRREIVNNPIRDDQELRRFLNKACRVLSVPVNRVDFPDPGAVTLDGRPVTVSFAARRALKFLAANRDRVVRGGESEGQLASRDRKALEALRESDPVWREVILFPHETDMNGYKLL